MTKENDLEMKRRRFEVIPMESQERCKSGLVFEEKW